MTWENCRLCEHCCSCCGNSQYKSDCDLCFENDNFVPKKHFKYCPSSGVPLNNPKPHRPVVIMGGGSPTKQEIEQAVAKYFKEHKFL